MLVLRPSVSVVVRFLATGIRHEQDVILITDPVAHEEMLMGLPMDAAKKLPVGGLYASHRSSPSHQQGRQAVSRKSAATPRSQSWSAMGSSRSEEHTSELQSLMRISYAVFC